MSREMTRAEVTDFLMHGTHTAKVATTMRSGQPHVMPVWFVLDGEEVVFTTDTGSVKARNLRRDPRIALVRRNAVPGELLLRVTPKRIIAETDVAGY